MSKTLRAWRASFTRRWHTNPVFIKSMMEIE